MNIMNLLATLWVFLPWPRGDHITALLEMCMRGRSGMVPGGGGGFGNQSRAVFLYAMGGGGREEGEGVIS